MKQSNIITEQATDLGQTCLHARGHDYDTLRIEESSHPKYNWPSFKNPLGELVISLEEFSEPES